MLFKITDNYQTLKYNVVLKRNAGHSKFSNIKHVNGDNDQPRSFIFPTFSQQIKFSVRGKLFVLNF